MTRDRRTTAPFVRNPSNALVLRDAGFKVEGTNEGGDEFYGLSLPDGRYVICGDESRNAGCWGADVFPSVAAFLNGDDRHSFPGTYATAADMVDAMRNAGLPL